ncbi:hypothetical protein C6P74_24090 [Burkholderia multivorans]|uniref:hypothetical protein n=1 Tax=Burkholderia multivorans TaxID=87883 RepID=UPI000CFF265D|nr:hypothetical protein [Burkholderia multivorans]PRD76171.1 hypothetical protein C6P74_24090 [Burkholderia multivorans]
MIGAIKKFANSYRAVGIKNTSGIEGSAGLLRFSKMVVFLGKLLITATELPSMFSSPTKRMNKLCMLMQRQLILNSSMQRLIASFVLS